MSHQDEVKITKKVALFIKEKRLAMGLTQQEFSEYIFGVKNKREWITRIENERGITVKTLERILKALKADINIIEN